VGGKVIVREKGKEKKKSRERDRKGGEEEIIRNVVNIFFNGDSELFITPISTIWVTAFKSAVYMAVNIFRI